MRIKRSLQLWPEQGTVHLYWRCHNKEFYLDKNDYKDLYFTCLDKGRKHRKLNQNCKIHAYCAMGNHFHQSTSYYGGSNHLSNFMRQAHSLFGARFNRLNKRSGKVAEGRPKTSLIQNPSHQMRVHFYIEANPIRAGFRTIENLKHYIYSSYGFYAYGLKTKLTHLLTIPDWYLELGTTWRQRQARYRALFMHYLNLLPTNNTLIYKKILIGNQDWIQSSLKELKNKIKNLISLTLTGQAIREPNST